MTKREKEIKEIKRKARSDLRWKQQQEYNDFPIGWAFNDEQFENAMKELGVSSPNELIAIYGGGFIRKTDRDAYIEMIKRHKKERTELNKKLKEFN